MEPLPRSFYQRGDVLRIARELLGKELVTGLDGVRTSGIITETEAYAGVVDRASHAWNGKRTPRNEVMYAEGGVAYVYLCYGMHHLFNVVTHREGTPHAVLIRAIKPLAGMKTMEERRGSRKLTTGGPGTLTQALGIRTLHNGIDLQGDLIRIVDSGVRIAPKHIITGPRIGVQYAGPDALLPYRFRIAPELVASLP